MAIRERSLSTAAYVSGGTTLVQLPRDAVYHSLQLSIMGGSFSTVQGTAGTGPILVPGFPWTLMRSIRVIRNGSDVVFQASGEQLAKESFYLNTQHPFARLYTSAANVETLITSSTRGVTIPANAEGIGANGGGFKAPDAPVGTGVLNFDAQVDLMFQLGVEDGYYSTLVDARSLSSYDLEIVWAAESAQIATAGTANTSNAAAFNLQVLSLDQDNLDVENSFGTFKRSTNQISSYAYGSSNNQLQLPRGNFFYGIQVGTKAYKAGSATVAIAENNVIDGLLNRINTNFTLRNTTYRQLQHKNMSDYGGRSQAFVTAQGGPQGYAQLGFTSAGNKMSEMIPTFAMDMFDLQISLQAQAAATNGATSNNTNGVIELLYEEVIPGVSVGDSSPRGASSGSIGRVSAKPYSR